MKTHSILLSATLKSKTNPHSLKKYCEGVHNVVTHKLQETLYSMNVKESTNSYQTNSSSPVLPIKSAV